MNDTTIDILLATFNGERFIAEQIESIQAQTYQNWRLRISDDCSSDRTLDIVRHYAAQDKRITVVSEGVRYGGAKENFFELIKTSNAPYCMFCDQDDVWLPKKVEKTLGTMLELENGAHDTPILVFTDMKVVDSDLNVIHESFERFSSIDPGRTKFSQVIAQALGAGCTMLVNRRTCDIALCIQSYSNVIMHDWWLCLVASAFGQIGYLDEPTSLYRQHGMNEVGALKYSPIKRASHLSQLKTSIANIVEQAYQFRLCYANQLNRSQLKAVDEFIRMGHTQGLPAIFHLIRSGCWKKGFRKVGQLIVAVLGLN